MKKPDEKDEEILNRISSSKLELRNIYFEDKCMRLIRKQTDLDNAYISCYRKSIGFYLAGILICLAIICFSLIAYQENIMFSLLLQAFSTGVICYIIIQIRDKVYATR